MVLTIEKAAQALPALGRGTGSAAITEGQLAGLPEPARRYLRYAQVIGKEPIRTVRLKQRGVISLREDEHWHLLTAEQYVTTDPPSFLWRGSLHLLPLVPISATDWFADGHGALRVKALSCIPLEAVQGPEIDQGELVRYLGEMAWCPTAFLADYIRWDAIDDARARATISLPGIAASAIFHVDEQGRCTHVTAERYREQHRRQVLQPWMGRWDDYREIDGLNVPMQAEALWTLRSREFSYFRAEVTEIVYNQAVPL